MRALRRNKRLVYYAKLDSRKPITDKEGYETGEYEDVYTEPTALWVSISDANGESYTQPFGDLLDYDRTIYDIDTELTESTRLWVDEKNYFMPHDYIVKRIAPSLNGVTVAIKKVEVSG